MSIEVLSTVFLAFALVHSFLTPVFAKLSKKFPADSIGESFFHLLAEVEVVFGFWAGIFLTVWAIIEGPSKVIDYQQSLNMTEPLFVFCIMILASTRPIVTIARTFLLSIVHVLSRIVPVDEKIIQIFVLLSFGPMLGSLITEPAAITILALLLYRMLDKADEKLLYGVLALLFVNISIGGGLTHFAAPPILIVAQKFGWGLKDVFVNLGEAVICAVFVNALLFCLVFKKKISEQISKLEAEHYPMPWWVIILHVLLMVFVVMSSHYQNVFMSLFMAFIGLTTVTKKYQDGLKFKEAFLVGFFLAGLIIFGSMQKWWLTPILQVITDKALFFAATGLTAVTDNAALTYLGSQVESLSNSSKWALVSGAITGGGLTILANAPNPAGFSILASRFPNSSLNAVKLLLAAIVPTAIACLFFMLLGNF
ncbi:putative Na+/H+ antiporter [Pseudobdellovibrio sp. HCB154]|uniref:putative Na+/H+ antiporter n=1 Tax=Pseudobdellovibrio sp. HCB154 TaxID=3386277 RepID=UPI0039176597